MRNAKALSTVILCFVIAGCGQKDPNFFGKPSPETPADTKSKSIFVMPKIKYPAAVIFEGGKGDVGFSLADPTLIRTWRLYICLENTAAPITGEVLLDFGRLGNAIESAPQVGNRKEVLQVDRLNSILLSYSYTTELLESANPVSGNAWADGRASFKSKAIPVWETVHSTPGYKPEEIGNQWTTSSFESDFSYGGSYFRSYNYELAGQKYYVAHHLSKVSINSKEKYSHLIDVCEKAGTPTVLQIGKDITPIN
jgi:hypothetical protein